MTQREELPEMTDSSSDEECGYSHRSYREYLERLLERREMSDRVSVNSQNEEAIEPSPVQSAEELESDIQDDKEGQAVTDSDPYDSGTDLDTGGDTVHAPKGKLSSKSKVNRVLRPRIAEKRQIRPVLRFTYDEPGKASERPLTIVHRGVIIKLGKH